MYDTDSPLIAPKPPWLFYVAAVAVGLVAALALALGLGAMTTPKQQHPAFTMQADDGGGETIAVKRDREPVESHPVRVVPISPLVQPVVVAPAPAPIAETPSVAEPAHPVREPGENGGNQGKQEGPTADPHLQGRPVPHPTSDICARHGGHREDYTRGSWRGWRCVFPKKGQ